MSNRRVVITGMGAVTPAGVGVKLFGDALEAGTSYINKIQLFDPSNLPVKIAAEILDVDFSKYLKPKHLRATHRVVPITLIAAMEALENSKLLAHDQLLTNLDVIVGTAAHGLGYFEEQAKLFLEGGYKSVSPHACTGTFVGMLSSEISMMFGCHGMSLVISTGCTSAHDAMGYAYNTIKNGGSNVILSGAGESCVTPLVVASFAKMGALAKGWNQTPQESSRPFDANRNGFVIGEGAWIFIMEELDHAVRRNAPIYAEVLGYSATSDAYHKTAPAPTSIDLCRAMTNAIKNAKILPSDINYINPHGTSTVLNDRAETAAIKLCFKDYAYQIPISSFKSVLGHAQGASGACGVAGTILAMNRGIVPPTINYTTPDPECDLDYVPNIKRNYQITTALINSVAFGSRNSSLIIRQYCN